MRTRSSSRAGPARRPGGQVLPAALGLLLAGALTLFVVFGAGQVVVAKQRVTDTADAAAWSAAVWRARVLNYQAYANRAILANEVAIAQAVTLLSWVKYFETLAENAATIATVFPPARAVLEAVEQAVEYARQAAEYAAEIEIPARGAQGYGYKEILQVSQEILNLSAGGFGLSMVAAEVARANHRDAFAFVLAEQDDPWRHFTRREETIDDRRRFADLVVASLDPFTAGPRSADVPDLPSLPCLDDIRLRKRGATTLSDTLDRWEAVDTVSLHLPTLRGLRCRGREAVPLGWGAAEAGEAYGEVVGTAGDVGINPVANELAADEMASIRGYAGITRIRELDYERLNDRRFPTTRVAVLAREPASAIGTAHARGLAAGRLLLQDRFAGEGAPRVWALSAAQVYFRRPPDAPARIEFASLFSPYWQARLVAPTAAERAQAWAHVR